MIKKLAQGQFTATVTEEEEAMPPRFMTNIRDAEVRRPESFKKAEREIKCPQFAIKSHV